MYVQRDDQGNVVGLFARPQENAREFIADDHPDVVAFKTPPPDPDPIDRLFTDPAVKALVEALDNGDVTPGAREGVEAIKTKVRQKL